MLLYQQFWKKLAQAAKLLLLILCSWLSKFSYTQEYIPMAVNNARWIITEHELYDPFNQIVNMY